MATERRCAANRANAAKSTGPRTAAGKARVAQNGCRHGLNRPVGRDPAFAGDIEAWARKICRLPPAPAADECPDPRLALELHLARRIAEAQVEVRRVRLARHRMQETALANPKYRSRRGNRARIEMLGQVVELRRLGIPLPDEMVQAFHHRHEGVEKFALILADHSGELFAFDRYERRALSRRNFAMRAFTEAQVVLADADAQDSAIDASSEVALDLSLSKLTGAQSPQARGALAAGLARTVRRPPSPQAGSGAQAGRDAGAFFSLPPCGGGSEWGVARLRWRCAPSRDPHPQLLPDKGEGRRMHTAHRAIVPPHAS